VLRENARWCQLYVYCSFGGHIPDFNPVLWIYSVFVIFPICPIVIVHHESVISILVGGQIGYVVFPEISRNFLNINSLTVWLLYANSSWTVCWCSAKVDGVSVWCWEVLCFSVVGDVTQCVCRSSLVWCGRYPAVALHSFISIVAMQCHFSETVSRMYESLQWTLLYQWWLCQIWWGLKKRMPLPSSLPVLYRGKLGKYVVVRSFTCYARSCSLWNLFGSFHLLGPVLFLSVRVRARSICEMCECPSWSLFSVVWWYRIFCHFPLRDPDSLHSVIWISLCSQSVHERLRVQFVRFLLFFPFSRWGYIVIFHSHFCWRHMVGVSSLPGLFRTSFVWVVLT